MPGVGLEVLCPLSSRPGAPGWSSDTARTCYSPSATCTAIGNERGISRETLRKWVRQAEVDSEPMTGAAFNWHGHKPVITSGMATQALGRAAIALSDGFTDLAVGVVFRPAPTS